MKKVISFLAGLFVFIAANAQLSISGFIKIETANGFMVGKGLTVYLIDSATLNGKNNFDRKISIDYAKLKALQNFAGVAPEVKMNYGNFVYTQKMIVLDKTLNKSEKRNLLDRYNTVLDEARSEMAAISMAGFKSTLTDESGKYSFNNLSAGTYALFIKYPIDGTSRPNGFHFKNDIILSSENQEINFINY